MSLDWHIQDVNGEPDATAPWVPIGVDAHADLFAKAGLNVPHQPAVPPLPLLARAADYYADAAYAPAEVTGLLAELRAIGPRAVAAVAVIAALAALCEEAVRQRRGIIVLAD